MGFPTVQLGSILMWGVAMVAVAAAQTPMPQGQSDFIEYCGGCHGLTGLSAPARVPQLTDRVGFFMCTPAGRDYLVRLPNVAHAPISGADELAAVMNFVVFKLGGRSVPTGAKPYTADEVERLRKSPIKPGAPLLAERRAIVDELMRRCGAPAALADYSITPPPGR